MKRVVGPECFRKGPAWADRREGPAAPPDGTIPLQLPLLLDRPRNGRRLVLPPREVREAAEGKEVLAAAIKYAEEGFPLSPVIAVRLGEPGPSGSSRTSPASVRSSCRADGLRRRGRSLQEPRPGRDAPAPGREGARRLLQGADRRGRRRVLEEERRLLRDGGLRARHTLDLGRAPISTDYRGCHGAGSLLSEPTTCYALKFPGPLLLIDPYPEFPVCFACPGVTPAGASTWGRIKQTYR